MKTKYYFILCLMCWVLTACIADSSASSQTNKTAQISKNNSIAEAKNVPTTQTPVKKLSDATEKPSEKVQSISDNELNEMLPNLLGSCFFLIESYEPSHLIGDFNGDGYADAAVVVGAQDKFGEAGETVNPYENLCYLSVDVSFQNILTDAFVSARPQQSCRETEKKKSVLQAKQSQYGLFIIFGDNQGLKSVSRKDDAFGRKFMLLDAVYEDETFEKIAADAKDEFALKIKKCVPSNIKSDIITSINSGGGSLAIYFDGKKFNHKQCGD